MLTIRPVLHTRKKPNGTQAVQICLYAPGHKRRFIQLGLAVAEAHWNENGDQGKLNWVRASRSSHKQDNLTIAAKITELRELAMVYDTPDKIIAGLNEKSSAAEQELADEIKIEPLCFKIFWLQYINDTAHRWGVYWKPKQESSLKTFASFHPEPLPFGGLTSQLLLAYEKWHLARGNAQTTAGKELSQIRAVYNAAIKARIASQADNPFSLFDIKHGTGIRQTLEWADLTKIEQANLSSFEMERSRDVFLFQFYAGGRRINEVLTLTWEDIGTDHFTYSELKHGKPVRKRRQLNLELKAILARYEQRKLDGRRFVFPIYKDTDNINQKSVLTAGVALINNGLYLIAEELGLPSFSSHVARHSWADLARKAGVDMYAISKNLGHSKLAVTEHYISAFDQEAVEDANERLIASRPV